ncbi:MAG: UbiA-like polyprenyltransferase [Planctomycetia bacterium]
MTPASGASRAGGASLADWLSLVRFSHSIFALPFAFIGAAMAAGGWPSARVAVLVVACAVLARTSAMAFNRWADRAIDADNPRTSAREIPAGRIAPRAALLLAGTCAGLFVLAAWLLNPLAGLLATPVLVVLLGYSYMKRVSSAAHIVLGLALAIAPLGAWIAVRGELGAGVGAVIWLAGGVLAWVAGFDLIYACQDAAFDRGRGLHSIPARAGVAFALRLSSALHVAATACFAMAGASAGFGWTWWLALAVAAALLVWEHSIVKPHDLSRVDAAFFAANGWVSVLLCAGALAHYALAGSSG